MKKIVQNNVYFSVFYRTLKEYNLLITFHEKNLSHKILIKKVRKLFKTQSENFWSDGFDLFTEAMCYFLTNIESNKAAKYIFLYGKISSIYSEYLKSIVVEELKTIKSEEKLKELFFNNHRIRFDTLEEIFDYFIRRQIFPFAILRQIENRKAGFGKTYRDYNNHLLKSLMKTYSGN